MDRRPPRPPAVAVDISSPSPSPRRPKKRQQLKLGGSGGPPPTLVVIDDDLTPQKADATRTPTFVAETPLSSGFAFDSDPSVVKCSLSRAKFGNASSDKFAGELILHDAKDERSFETHTPYLRETFDEGTKATQLAKAKLGSEGLSTGQEDTEAGTLEDYVIVLLFELS
ncbi:hypothetical protein BHE74_00030448 [Ensete ventricosum]|nr:hypothetical protein BHE74_00030448 [Ensete ventricosum]